MGSEMCIRDRFRFGPGKRIWSTKALVFAVTWGGHTVILRVSVVDPDVPFLLSKGVFKRLGAQIDLEVNECVFRRLNRGVEMLHDLTSGHVGIELVKPGGTKPVASKTAIDLCKAGVEVTLEDEALRNQLPEAVKSHGTHVVALPEDDKHGTSADDEDHSTLETKREEETSSDEDQEHVLEAFGTHHLNPRSRAAPHIQ